MTISRDHAVVLGGSIAGMLAARVLADEFSHVSVVERDPLPGGRTGHRRGVPHGHHVHGLLTRGQMVMEDLLPGLTSQLRAQRALTGDLQGNVRWYVAGRQLPQAIAGLPLVSASRPLIEGSIRARVRALPNVTIWDGYDVVGLTASADGQRITGARVGRSGDGATMNMFADLVVDATGRGSRTPLWLGELGHQPPAEERVRIDLGYASALFEAPPRELIRDDIVISTARFPGQNRGGVLQMLEGGRCLVTLAGILGEHPPVDPDGFVAYAKTLAAPATYEIIRAALPLTEPTRFRMPTYVRRRYERLRSFPAGLLVTGDAVCNFNPVYGQGMSVAAMDAEALRQELRRGGEPQAARYFRALARALDAPWSIAVGADLTVPEVAGPRTRKGRLISAYVRRLQAAALDDVSLATAFIRVASLVDAPPALMRPERALRVFRHRVRTSSVRRTKPLVTARAEA
jgi:2-polyprenyl-6-methoxyphenol hydroxylase-like FAD-dependent oxidoreductase